LQNEVWGVYNAPSSTLHIHGVGSRSLTVMNGMIKLGDGDYPAHTHPKNFPPSSTDYQSAQKLFAPVVFVVIGIDQYHRDKNEWWAEGTLYYYDKTGLLKKESHRQVRLQIDR